MTSLDFQALDLRRLAMDPVTCAPRNKVRSMDKTFVVAWTAIFSAVRQTHVAGQCCWLGEQACKRCAIGQPMFHDRNAPQSNRSRCANGAVTRSALWARLSFRSR